MSINKFIMGFLIVVGVISISACNKNSGKMTEIEQYFADRYALAVEGPNIGEFNFFASKVADPSIVYIDGKKKAALNYAANHHRTEIVNRLLDMNVKFSKEDSESGTALMWAIRMDYTKLAIKLINAGADVNARKFCGKSVLEHAIYGRKPLFFFEKLFDKGAIIHDKKIVELAVICHCDFDVIYFLYNKAKEQGVSQKMDECIRSILEDDVDAFCNYLKKASGNIKRGSIFEYAYRMTAGLGKIKMIKALKLYGYNLNDNPDGFDESLLITAAAYNQIDTVRYLVDIECVDVNKLSCGTYAIMQAVKKGNIEIVRYLLSHGADKFYGTRPELRDMITDTIVFRENYELAKLILPYEPSERILSKKMIGIKSPDKALDFFLANGYIIDNHYELFANSFMDDNYSFEFYKKLLDKCIEEIPDIKSIKNKPILNRSTLNTDKLAYFLSKIEYIPDLHDVSESIFSYKYGQFCVWSDCWQFSDSELQKLMFIAAQIDDCRFLELLIAKGVNINCKDEDGMTPLMMCFKMQNLMAAKRLIELGADCSIKDSNGNTVRYYAKSTKYKLALDMLLQ